MRQSDLAVAGSSPWVGLEFYTENQRDYFRGREPEQRIIASNLRARRLTILYGSTGVGKTSLLLAGVVPTLQLRNAVLVFREWQSESFLDDLRHRCEQIAREHGADGNAEQPLDVLLSKISHATGSPVLVVFDQFEEYFVSHPTSPNGNTFEPELARAINRPDLDVGFLFSLREESIAALDRFHLRIPNLLRNLIRLEHLTTEAAADAVRDVLAAWNEAHGATAGEDELLLRLVRDVSPRARGASIGALSSADASTGSVEAPFLQLVLQRLWDEEGGASPQLRLSTYEELGGADGIVADHFGSIVDDLTPKQRELCARFFDRLVTPSGGKIAYPVADLDSLAAELAPQVPGTLDVLSRARILREISASDFKAVEIFHDVLAPTILAWKAKFEQQEQEEQERRRRRTLTRWLVALAAVAALALCGLVVALVERGHAKSAARSAKAGELQAIAAANLSTDPRKSLDSALRAARLEPTDPRMEVTLRNALIASRVRAVLRAAGPVGTVAFIRGGRLVLVAGGTQVRLFDATSHTQVRALPTGARITATTVVGRDRLFIGTAAGTTFIWDGAGWRRWLAPGPGAVTSISNARDGSVLVTWARGRAVIASTRHAPVALAERDSVVRGAIDPTGRFIAVVERDRVGHVRARLYAGSTGALLRAYPMLGVTDVAFNASGSLLAIASHKGTTLWRVERTRAGPTRLHDGGVETDVVAFAPAGGTVATGGQDGVVRVSSVASGELLFDLVGDSGAVAALSWSRDGRVLADATTVRTAHMWVVAGPTGRGANLVTTLTGSFGPLTAVAFSPDARLLVTGSTDGTARIYDAHVDEELKVLGHLAGVSALAVSPREDLVAAVGAGGVLKIWDASHEHLLYAARPQTRLPALSFASLAFSADGKLLMSVAGNDVSLRDPRDPERVSRFAVARPIRGAALSRDGSTIAVAGGSALEVWRLHGLARVGRTRIPLSAKATAVSVSADGTRVLATTGDGAVTFWTATGRKIWEHHAPGPTVAVIGPDDQTVAVGGAHGKTLLWRHSEPEHVLSAPRPSRLTAVVFSPDGKRLLTTWMTGDPRLWDVANGRKVRDLVGQRANVATAAFSPDGRWIATGGPIAAALWWVQTGEKLFFLYGPMHQVTSVAFGPESGDVASASGDNTVRFYDCKVCGDLNALTAQAQAELSQASR